MNESMQHEHPMGGNEAIDDPKQPEPKKSQFDKVREHFGAKLGMDWHVDIPLTIKADTLSWFVHLIEEGIEARKQRFKKEKEWGATAVMSVTSWSCDLEELVKQIIAAKPKTGKK